MVLNPRVAIAVQSNLTLTAAGGQAVIALIGTAQWGSLSQLQTFSSFTQLLDYYQEDKTGLSIIKAADIAYTNGANTVKVIRIGDGTQAKATKALAGNGGATSNVLTFSGLYEGTYGNNILVTVATVGSGRTVTVTDGVSIESYTNDNNSSGYITNAAIATDINANSALVTVAVLTGSETSNLVDAVSNQALIGGQDGTASLAQSHFTAAFDSFLNSEDWDVLIAPGTDALNAGNSFQATMLGRVNTRASGEKKYGMFISGIALDESIATAQARTAAGERLTIVAPGLQYTPRSTGVQTNFNGTYLACAYAGLIAILQTEESTTRKVLSVEGVIVSTSSGKQFYNLGEVEQLLTARIVPVSKLEGGIKVARGVTRITDKSSVFFEENIVRIVDNIKANVQLKLDPFLGNPNLQRVRKSMASAVDGILQQGVLDELLVAYLPTEVSSGVSPDTVNVSMVIQPTFAVNFINVTMAVSRL